MKKKAGVSVYIDLGLKEMVDIIAPLHGTTLSELINHMMENYVKEHAPCEILDKKISDLEIELSTLKSEREACSKSANVADAVKHYQAEQAAKQEHEAQASQEFRQSKFNDPETIRSLTYQIKKKTIDWNTIKNTLMFPSAIDARIEVLSYLLQLGKIDEHDCKGV